MLYRRIKPEAAAKKLFGRHVDATQIWADVCRLGAYSAPASIACCEVAFARIAILKFLCLRMKGQLEGSAVCSALDSLVVAGFAGDDEETRQHYGLPLQQAACAAVETYLSRAHHPAEVGTLLLSRIDGQRSPELVSVFATFGEGAAKSIAHLRVQEPKEHPHSRRAHELTEQLRHLTAK